MSRPRASLSCQHRPQPAIMEYAAPDAKDRREPAERRTCARLTVNSLIFVKVGDLNGGIAFNISEDGLALSAASCLPDGRLPTLWIQLPESDNWIRAEGQIAWRGTSNKEAGVRFVGLPQDARQRIKDWICSDSWNAGSTPESDHLRTSKETQVESAVFNNSPILLDQTDVVPERIVQRASSPSVNPYYPEAICDRRVYPRKRIIPLGYIQLGEANGGIALNVSEGGLAITAAMVLLDDHLPSIRLQFPDAGHWVDVKGEIVWKSESRREAGIRFVDLTEEARLLLQNWISSPTHCGSIQEQEGLIRPKQEQEFHLEFLSGSRGSHPIKGPLSPFNAAKRDVESSLASVGAAGLNPTDSWATDPSAKAPLLTRSIKRNLRVRPILDHCLKNAGRDCRVLRRVAALVGLIGLVLLTQKWILLRPGGAQVIEAVAHIQRVWTGEALFVARRPSARTGSAPQPQVDATKRQAHNIGPLLPEKSESVSVPSTPQKNLPRRVEAPEGSAAFTAFRDPIRSVRDSRASNRATAKSSLAAAAGTGPAFENNRSHVASVPPVSWPQQDARVTTPLTPLVSQPTGAPSTGLENRAANRDGSREGPSPLPKRAESTAIVNATVAILTDPYPSIRLPHAPHGKKGRRGTSLQLGQLISRVEPAYPEEARQKGIEGTVKIHVIVGREGVVQQLVSVDGPPLLVPATVHAVRQWRYTETLLAGQAVETEDDIAVTFRLSSLGVANK